MSKRRRPSTGRRIAEAKFWGSAHAVEALRGAEGGSGSTGGGRSGRADQGTGGTLTIVPTTEPGALVRSLGAAPLAVDPRVAERCLTAVYEEAVKTGTALAAANGLLASPGEDRDA